MKNDICPLNSAGSPHGEWITYHHNGAIMERENWNNGRREGRYTNYYADGRVLEDCYFVNNEIQGEHIRRHSDGSLASHAYYYDIGELNLLFHPKLTDEDKFEISLKYGVYLWLD